MKPLAILLLLGLLLGCGSAGRPVASGPSPRAPTSAMERVSLGMSGDRVRELLGEPLAVEDKREDEETESWYYESGVVILRRGEVIFRGPVPGRSRR
ncbi:MAG: hypothetical protein R6X33_04790 [Candidatus Brocadiia bacterium]